MRSDKSGSLVGILFSVFLAAANSGCGGGAAATPSLPIGVALSSATATVLAGATVQFTASVVNDPADKGVSWTLTQGGIPCSSGCGTVSPASTASGVPTTYTAPAPPPSDLNVTLTATSVADTSKSAAATITVPAITVSVSPASLNVAPGTSAQFTGTVNNDYSNDGVVWTLTQSGTSCSPGCGTVAPSTAASGVPTTYTAPSTLATNPASVTLTAAAVADTAKSAASVITNLPVTITATVSVGTNPIALSVNTATNQIYVAGAGMPGSSSVYCGGASGTATVIDGATGSTSTVGLGAVGGPYPFAITVDSSTNSVYILSHAHTIAGGACEGYYPWELISFGGTPLVNVIESGIITIAMAVDLVNNKLYVADVEGNNVLVFDVATNTLTATIPLGFSPGVNGLAVNQATNLIYVVSYGNFSVIDGATNAVTTVADPDAANGFNIGVNATTNKIYITNASNNNVSVVDGTTTSITTVTDPNANDPVALAVNETTNTIYVANMGSNNVTVIDGATNSITTVAVGVSPVALAVSSASNRVYVANAGSSQTGDVGSITVIDGATDATATLIDPNAKNPAAVAVDPVNKNVYIANSGSNNVTVIDDSQ